MYLYLGISQTQHPCKSDIRRNKSIDAEIVKPACRLRRRIYLAAVELRIERDICFHAEPAAIRCRLCKLAFRKVLRIHARVESADAEIHGIGSRGNGSIKRLGGACRSEKLRQAGVSVFGHYFLPPSVFFESFFGASSIRDFRR